MQYRALRIPVDESEPITEFRYDTGRAGTVLAEQLGTETIGMSSFAASGIVLGYDDVGLYTQPQNTNLRAMKLWAGLSGRSVRDFMQPLVGPYVVLGVNNYDGEDADSPEASTVEAMIAGVR